MTQRAHLIKCKSTGTAVDIFTSFFSNTFKLHGHSDNIVVDKDPKLTSEFRKRLMELCDIKLKMSSSRHSQTDGAL